MSTITIVYEAGSLKAGCAKILEAELFQSRAWMLYRWAFDHVVCDRSHDFERLAICVKDGKPVSVVAITNYYGQHLAMAFTAEAHRGCGYASQCIAALEFGSSIVAAEGLAGTLDGFWAKHLDEEQLLRDW